MREPDGRRQVDVQTVAELIRREADGHHPDADRIMARVERGRRRAQAARPTSGASRSRREPRVAGQVAGAAVAAVALMLSVTGVQRAAGGLAGVLDGSSWSGAPMASVTLVGPSPPPATPGGPGASDLAAPPAEPGAGSASGPGPVGPGRAGPAGPPASDSASSASAAASGQASGQAAVGDRGGGPDGAAAGTPVAASGPHGGTTAPARGRVATPPPAGPAPGPATPGSAPPATPPTPTPATAAPVLRVTPQGSGTHVTLPGPGDTDWLVVGSRRDGKTVRAKRGSGAILAVTAEAATPAVAQGPLLVSWLDGTPEQDHVDAATWWTVPAAQGRLRIVVRLDGPTTVVLQLGTAGVPPSARIDLTAAVTAPGTTAPGPGAGAVGAAVPAGASVATVAVPRAAAGSTLTLTLSAATGSAGSASGGVVALSAVSVR